ncbi:ankyrin [Penicillium herquei]|nr:ankyrin [Penicillium herquei]
MEDPIWEAHKAVIKRLYIEENKTLKDVMRIMGTDYHFYQTESSYVAQLGKWNFKKNTNRGTWKYVKYKFRKNGVETDVIINGRLQPRQKVRREINRQAFQRAIDHFRSGMNFISGDSTGSVNTVKRLFPQIDQEIVRTLQSESPDFVGLRKEHQAHTLASTLGSATEYSLEQFLQMTMFLLSNKLPISGQSQSLDQERWVTEEDQLILKLLEVSGLSSTLISQHLFSSPYVSARAISERLFQSAIRMHDLDTVKAMLQGGMSPGLPIPSFKAGKCVLLSPLEFAASLGPTKTAIDLTKLLLSSSAKIDDFKLKPVLQTAIEAIGNISQSLESTEYSSDSSIETSAIENSMELLNLILTCQPDLQTRICQSGNPGSSLTVLGLAVSLGLLEAARLLIRFGADLYATQRTYLDIDCPDFETNIFGLASKRGDITAMQMLLDSMSIIRPQNPASEDFVKPLILAVTFGREGATDFLLKKGVTVRDADAFLRKRNPDQRLLFERALAQRNQGLNNLLIEARVEVNDLALKDYRSLEFFHSINQSDYERAKRMLFLGASPHNLFEGFPESSLSAAIAQGNHELIGILKVALVEAEGLCIPYIPNKPTALFLEIMEFLPTILLNNGQQILTCAILQDNHDGLVDFLLDRSVDKQRVRPALLGRFDNLSESLNLPECRSPLEAAFTQRNMTLARKLIQRGAPITEMELNAVVWQAVLTDNDSQVLEFLAMCSNPLQAPTAVGMAIIWGRFNLVNALLQSGVNPKGPVHITDPPEEDEEVTFQTTGWWHLEPEEVASSVLQVAASKGEPAILQLLLNSVDWLEKDKSIALTTSVFWGNHHLLPGLLAAGARVNQGMLETSAAFDKVNTEMLPLQIAVNVQNIDLVKFFIKIGARVNQLEAGVGGRTPLQTAAKVRNIELVKMLLESGAEVNHPPAAHSGATALQYAAIEGHLDVVGLLLDCGADPNASGSWSFGRTALEGAAEGGHIDTMQFLLNRGASVDGPFRVQFVRSVKLAEMKGHLAAGAFLRASCGWTQADQDCYEHQRFDEEEPSSRWIQGPMS